MSLQIYNWQCAGAELATYMYMYSSCRGATGEAKSASACITSLCFGGKNNIGGY